MRAKPLSSFAAFPSKKTAFSVVFFVQMNVFFLFVSHCKEHSMSLSVAQAMQRVQAGAEVLSASCDEILDVF